MILNKHNRRRFFQLVASGIGFSMVYLWDKMMENRLLTTAHKKIVLPLSRRQVSFFNDFLVINQNRKIEVLSSHCTHLGCVINKVENGKLVCPCHGSEFDMEGNALKGPAYKPLKSYPFKKSSDGQQIILQSSDT